MRYYLIEATNSIRYHEPSFAAYYRKNMMNRKLINTKEHSHSRLVRQFG